MSSLRPAFRLAPRPALRTVRPAAPLLATVWLPSACATAPAPVPATPVQRPLPPETPLAREVAAQDQRLGRQYRMWLYQRALRGSRREQCIEMLGRSSRRGPVGCNEQLSPARAEVVRKAIGQHAPAARHVTRIAGRGVRQNISGTAGDDARDAVDRRVEFRLVTCSARRPE